MININTRWRQCFWPYGVYHCYNGDEVLFNRNYQPIWKRNLKTNKLGEQVTNLTWQVPDIIHDKQLYFYDDARTPEKDIYTYNRCIRVMNAFCTGEPIRKYGKPVVELYDFGDA